MSPGFSETFSEGDIFGGRSESNLLENTEGRVELSVNLPSTHPPFLNLHQPNWPALLQPTSQMDATTFDGLLQRQSPNVSQSAQIPPANMAEGLTRLSRDFLTRIPCIKVTSSADEIMHFVSQIRFVSGKLPEGDEPKFLQLVELDLDEIIRNSCTDKKIKTLKELADHVENEFGNLRSVPNGLGEIEHMHKLAAESYAQWGRRLLEKTRQMCRQIEFSAPAGEKEARKNFLEEIVVLKFKASVKDAFCYPKETTGKTLAEVINKVAKSGKERYENTLPSAHVAVANASGAKNDEIFVRIKKCQKCRSKQHEFLECPAAHCIYCADSGHKSINCNIIPTNLKLIFACKECSGSGHTVDSCKEMLGKETYCQVCQSLGHEAVGCNLKLQKYCSHCKKPAHEGEECKLEVAVVQQQQGQGNQNQQRDSKNSGQNNGQRGQNQRNGRPKGPCFICNKNGHIARDCWQKNGGKQNQGNQSGNNQNQNRNPNYRGKNYDPNYGQRNAGNQNFGQNYNQNDGYRNNNSQQGNWNPNLIDIRTLQALSQQLGMMNNMGSPQGQNMGNNNVSGQRAISNNNQGN